MSPETAVLLRSDHHRGKRTASFNAAIYKERLESSLLRVVDVLSRFHITEFVGVELGDAVDGAGIYPGQAFHQDAGDANTQAICWADENAAWYWRLQQALGVPVRVVCVPGNHGRSGFHNHERQNYDLMAYELLARSLSGVDGITVDTGREEPDPFLRVAEIRGHRFLLSHGADIRSAYNIPWYGMQTRILRWQTTKLGPFAAACFGHFHTCGAWPINGVQMITTGTMVSDDDWSLRVLGYESSTRWWLFGANDARPVTWRFDLELRA